ncbi:MAG TPA: PilN domain-containing protein [Steroidobacteraceae bacterium]|jgi:type IV pilus assembly protein PilN|nr:PilN domain-containing protein [Steroidobacteraceae bacterium]
MPRINLLPWREQQRKERKLAFFVALGGAAVGALLAAFAGYLLVNSMIGAQERRNERLRTEIKAVDRQIEQINDLESQKQRFISRMQVIEKLQRSRSEVVHLFDEVAKTVPDGTYLTSFKQDGKHLKFEGVAQSSTRVSTFMRNISGSQWMKDPELEVVESKPGNSIGNSFILDASQVVTSGDEDQAAPKPKRLRVGGTP